MNRRDKHNYYLDMADVARERGTCLRRNYGAVIVKNGKIIVFPKAQLAGAAPEIRQIIDSLGR